MKDNLDMTTTRHAIDQFWRSPCGGDKDSTITKFLDDCHCLAIALASNYSFEDASILEDVATRLAQQKLELLNRYPQFNYIIAPIDLDIDW